MKGERMAVLFVLLAGCGAAPGTAEAPSVDVEASATEQWCGDLHCRYRVAWTATVRNPTDERYRAELVCRYVADDYALTMSERRTVDVGPRDTAEVGGDRGYDADPGTSWDVRCEVLP